ncbi:MAG: extracellular solute-binding protein [Chloroflexales bacterium]|nr:extracellular solute-binding protein [Chloroflexales bacterium]
MRRQPILWLASIAIISLMLSACGQQAATPSEAPANGDRGAAIDEDAPVDEAAPSEGGLVFWSTETEQERVDQTQAIIDRFTEQTGIQVELVPTSEDILPELLTTSVAAGDLPDIIFHPIDFAIGWYQEGILDAAAATQAIEALGPDTFSAGALSLVEVSEGYAAIPSDGWGQLLIYRQDRFAAAGLEAPTTFAQIQVAAAALNDPDNNFYGITAATKAGEVFTQQTFEHFALANNCQLVNDAGDVTLNSPECVEAISAFTDLLRQYGPPGEADVSSTRATYFAGQSAMVVWSPFILDEMAGLRDNALPTCPECASDPAFLARNSGFIPSFAGPSGSPAQYGQISLMGITSSADVEAAIEFLTYWFNDAYLDWLAVSPEGKLPMRRGTSDEPTRWVDGWGELETGVDRRGKLGDFYGEEVLSLLIEGTNNFNRWGFPQGQGALVAAIYESLPAPALLRETIDEVFTPDEAAEEMQLEVEDLQRG